MRKPSFAISNEDLVDHRASIGEQGISSDKSPASLGKLNKESIGKRDVFGRNLLHLCVLSNDVASFKQALRASEVKCILPATDLENGWNVLHYILYHKRLRCFRVLMSFLDFNSAAMPPLLLELLKKKDRSGATPMSLLQNDAKDLFWIPQYINEKNRYHLARRFDRAPADGDSDITAENEIDTARETVAASENSQNNTKVSKSHRNVSHDWWDDARGASDVYVYGANANTNLGTGDTHDRAFPSRISLSLLESKEISSMDLRDLIRSPRYRFMKMAKYHSVLCTTEGKLLTCGIGSRGRLGHGNALNCDQFKEVVFPESVSIVECAVSNNHTVVLTSAGALYAWGQNTLNQLGFTSAAPFNSFKTISDVYENSPVEITSGDLRRRMSPIKGITASKIHTIAHSSHSLYFWGLHIGQINISSAGEVSDHRVNDKTYKGVIISQPKEVQMPDEIKLVTTCETCTVVVTVSNEIYLFYMGQRVKIPRLQSRVSTEDHFDLFKPSKLNSAPSIKKVSMKSQSCVHILLDSGDVLTFGIASDDIKAIRNMRYNYAWSASELSMRAVDIDNSYDGSLAVCTRNGSVLTRSNSAPSTLRRGSSSSNAQSVHFAGKKKFKKLEGINRVLRVVCNDSFSSLAFLKDDIDSLPLKLQQNDFFLDMEYLTPFVEPDMYRKQDQLLDTDHDMNCYTADFFYPPQTKSSDSDEDRLLLFNRLKDGNRSPKDREPRPTTNDLLRKSNFEKYDASKTREPPTKTVFQRILDVESKPHFSILKASLNSETPLVPYEWSAEKFADGSIEFAHLSDYKIGIHIEIFRRRSKLCQQIFSPKEKGEYFIHQHIEGAYIPDSKTIVFRSQIEPLAVLVFVYFVYTNTLLDFWQDFSSSDESIEKVRRIKRDVFSLIALFKMDLSYSSDDMYLGQFSHYESENPDADVTVYLSEGDSVQCSSSIISRSAFFETILSGRWETSKAESEPDIPELGMKYVSLEEISLLHMKVILNHLQGGHDLRVFEEAKSVVLESHDSDDFVNFLLEMIELSDELLLVQLKHLCELAIKEFINIDNVLILLGHADWTGAGKLFMSCCWYIYNNLEVLIFDQNFRILDDELVGAIEGQVQFLNNCRHPHFVTGDQGQIDAAVSGRSAKAYSDSFVAQFIHETTQFNEIFMSDAKGFCSFEPLVDVRSDFVSGGEDRRKSDTRRMSSKGRDDLNIDMRKLSLSAFSAPAVASHTPSRRESDCAIDDEEEFEVVTSRRRKSKPNSSIEKPRDLPSLSRGRLPSTEGPVTPVPVVPQSKPQTESSSSRRDSVNSRKLVHTPLLGESLTVEKKQTKIKVPPPMKLSQKERRKLRNASEPSPQTTSQAGVSKTLGGSNGQQGFRNPWNTSKPETASEKAPVQSNGSVKLKALPVLGQKEAPAPKLSAIILEEATRLAEEKEPVVTKTLQEIQQEQEFARWWEEECKRVQQIEAAQIAPLLDPRYSGEAGPSSKRGGRSKRGRGKRGGLLQ